MISTLRYILLFFICDIKIIYMLQYKSSVWKALVKTAALSVEVGIVVVGIWAPLRTTIE